MSSKVKEPLQNAKEFAANDNEEQSPTEVIREQHKAHKESTFIANGEGEPSTYATQQGPLNTEVRNKVLEVERRGIDVHEQHPAVVRGLKSEADEIAKLRTAAINNFQQGFFLHPKEVVSHQAIHEDCKLTFDLQHVLNFSAKKDSLNDTTSASVVYLDELVQEVRATVLADATTSIHGTCCDLLDDDAIANDTILAMRSLGHADVFSLLRSSLAGKGREIEALKAELLQCNQMKADAAAIEDMHTVEEYSMRQIKIQEDIIERIQERLREIYMANEDVTNFCDNFMQTREAADSQLAAHTETNKERFNNVKHDIDTLIRVREEKTTEDANAEAAHHQFLSDSNSRIQKIQHQQSSNWEKIMELLEENTELSRQREVETSKQLEQHMTECERKSVADSYITGVENYLEDLQHTKAAVGLGSDWINSIRTFVSKMCSEVEKKNVEEEAVDIRIQEQLDYLDAYRSFKSNLDQLIHGKEVRVMSLGRMIRNLELQVKEATVSLDPNKRKYEAELEGLQEQIGGAKLQLDDLTSRAKHQSKQWQPTEDQLEDAGVDFEPPDIEAERSLCEKKAETLNVARQYLNSEQEMMDKDAMQLRKLKTANKVAVEGVESRRKERVAANDTPQEAPAAQEEPSPAVE